MANERLLIVEDERIVAEDLSDMLTQLGYEVTGIASTGEEAIQKAQQTQPDLVLMDIRLNGELDGIQAAESIWTHQGIPVTYLTAYADESTLERAKATMPFGYILKPFEERDLRTTIEIALYKHQMEGTLKSMEGWHANTLESIADGIITTNSQEHITFMNPAAENLTGWTLRQAYGKSFRDTVRLSAGDDQLTTRSGQTIPVQCQINPLKNEDAQPVGKVILLHPAASRRTSHSSV